LLRATHNIVTTQKIVIFFVEEKPEGTQKIADICDNAFNAVLKTIKPEMTANDAYQAKCQ
jgi:Xaa-Pro aminopeptidase